MKKYQAVIFDLDGTLLNTLADLAAAANHTLKVMHYPLRTQDEVRMFVGNGVPKLIERILPEGERTSEKQEEAYKIFTKYYSAHATDFTLPYLGTVELVKELTQKNVPWGVVTNKDEAEAKPLIKKFFGGDSVVGGRSDKPKKPDPWALEKLMEGWQVDRAATLYVGDSGVDFSTAQNAKVDCALVSWGFCGRAELEKLHPTYLIDSAEQLEKIIFKEE